MSAAQRSNPRPANAKSPQGGKASAGKGKGQGKGQGQGQGQGQGKPQGKPPAAALPASPRHESASLRVAWFCLHLIVFLVPIAISNLTWTRIWLLPLTYDQFDIAKVEVMRALTLIGFAAWSWHVLMRGGDIRLIKRGGPGKGRFFTWFEFLVLAMLAWLALTTITSIHPPTALFGKYRRFEGLISFVNYAVVFFMTVQLADRPSRIRSLVITLFFSNLIVSGYGMLQYFGSVSPATAQAVLAMGGRLAAMAPLLVAGVMGVVAVVRRERDGLTAFEWAGVAAGAWTVVISGLALANAAAPLAAVLRYEWLLLLLAFLGGATWVLMAMPEKTRGAYLKAAVVVIAIALVLTAYTGAMITNAKTIAAQSNTSWETSSVSLDLIRWGNLPFETNRGFSTYGNPDLLGGFLVFPLIASLALALSEQKRWWRALYWSGFLLTVAAWITAFVRGAWIGGVVGLIAFAIAARMSKVKPRRVDWAFVIIAVVVIAAIVGVSLQSESAVLNVGERLASITKTGEGSALTRTQIWTAAVRAVAERPIVGFGLDTFRLIFPQFKPYEYVAAAGYLSVADNVHNYPLQLASGVGVPGLILVYGCLFVAAWIALPLAFVKGGGGGPKLLQAGIWAACAAYVAHLVFGLSVTGSTIFLWLFVGLLLSPLAENERVQAPAWGTGVAVVVLIACGALSVGNIVYAYADNYYLKGRIATGGSDRVRAIEQSIKLNPSNDMYRSELGLAHQDIAVNAILQARNAQQSGGDPTAYFEQGISAFTQAENALKSAIEFVPTEYDNYVFLTNLYNFGADYIDPAYRQQAIEWGRKGVEVEPYGPAIRYQLTVALAGAGQTDAAIKEITAAVEMDPNYFEAWSLLGDINQRKGDLAAALDAYTGGLKASSGNGELRTAYQGIFSTLSSAGPSPVAIESLKTVMGYAPTWAQGALMLGAELEKAGDEAGAAKIYRDTIATMPIPPEDAGGLAQLQDALAALEASGTP